MGRRPRNATQHDAWDPSVPMLRVGDLVLTQGDGAARLARILRDAHAASASPLEPPPDARLPVQQLPGKQAGLLDFLMRHHRHIVSKSRLIEAVWGAEGVAPSVLDVHMARLRRALEHLDATGHQVRIETRRGMGYALHVDE